MTKDNYNNCELIGCTKGQIEDQFFLCTQKITSNESIRNDSIAKEDFGLYWFRC